MKNTLKTFMIIAIAAVIMFGMAACDDGGGGKTVTFSLDKIDATHFTVTVQGAEFNQDVSTVGGMLSNTYSMMFYTPDRTSDTVVTFTITHGVGEANTISIAYPDNGAYFTNGGGLASHGTGNTTYKADPSKSSITFP